VHQFLELDIVWPDAEHGGNGAVQDMVYALIFSRLFISGKVPGIFHHHDNGMISAVIGADRAFFGVGQRIAFLTVADMLLGLCHGPGQLFHLGLRHVDYVEGKALRRFAANAGKACQFIN